MKICFIIASLGNGGAERVLATLAAEFCKNYEVQILKFDDKPSFYDLDKRIKLTELPQFKWHNLYHKIASRVKKFLALKRALKQSEADVFISFLDTTNIACILANAFSKTPLIISEHSSQQYLKSKIWRLLRRLTYPYAKALTTLSYNDKSYYEKFVKNVKVLYNPCHFELCEDLEKENLVLFVGRLDANKNCAMFLQMIAFLPSDLRQKYRFVIAGDGEQRQFLQDLALNLKVKCEFLGRVKDMQSLYKRAKFICLCSFVEGLPTILIESLFFKIVRLSTAYESGVRELISDKKDGFIVPQNDALKMTEILQILMNDEKKCEEIAQNALKRCEEFSPQTILKQWLELIASVQKGRQ